MAIDTKSLTEVITEFRALQSKDAISPDSLGYILQRIVDLLATAGTSETISKITSLLDSFKAAGQAITALSQGQADRDHIYANKSTVNLATGAVASSSGIFIQQATTERAGAMRAQQVIDLNATKKAVAEVEKILEIVQVKLGMTEGSKPLFNTAQISVLVVNGVLEIHGAQQLIADGYVPYLFRLTRKRNQWGDTFATNSTNPHSHQSRIADGYSTAPITLVTNSTRDDGTPWFGWGRSSVSLLDSKTKNHRMIRLRFAVGFAKKILPGRSLFSTA